MNYVDIAIIALAAIFALLGLWKGFGKTGIKLICFAVALLVTWLLADRVLGMLLKVGFIRGFIVGDSSISLASLYYKGFNDEILAAGPSTPVSGALGLLVNPLIETFTKMGGPEAFHITYARFVADMLAINTLNVVLCLVLYGIVRIIAHILSWLLRKLFLSDDKEVRVWSRLLGFVLGLGRGVIFTMVLLIISTIIIPFGFAKPYNEAVNESIIGKFSAKYTYVVLDKALYGEKKTEGLLAAAGIEKNREGEGDEFDFVDGKIAMLAGYEQKYNEKRATLEGDAAQDYRNSYVTARAGIEKAKDQSELDAADALARSLV